MSKRNHDEIISVYHIHGQGYVLTTARDGVFVLTEKQLIEAGRDPSTGLSSVSDPAVGDHIGMYQEARRIGDTQGHAKQFVFVSTYVTRRSRIRRLKSRANECGCELWFDHAARRWTLTDRVTSTAYKQYTNAEVAALYTAAIAADCCDLAYTSK